MSDRIVIVTGAGGAVGRVATHRWLATGAQVVAVDRTPANLDPLGDHPNLTKLPGDLLTTEGAESIIGETRKDVGIPDTLIHTVGGFAMSPIDRPDAPAQWDLMLALNATTTFHAYRAMVPGLKERGGGWLVGISSRSAVQPAGRMSGYAAGKAALIALTQSLADELRRDNIHVNVILASTIDTPANRAAMGESHAANWVTPDDIAEATLYLCSDQARSVHGATLEVYGKS